MASDIDQRQEYGRIITPDSWKALTTGSAGTKEHENDLMDSTKLNDRFTLMNLLLNYFVTMALEDSAIRMAKELGYIKNNKDAVEFNETFCIRQRFEIKRLIKRGKIVESIELINKSFGIDILESKASTDIHFKLLLLNVIEMIRDHYRPSSEKITDDDGFILNLIEYCQQKIAIKASECTWKMKELELVVALLLFPLDSPEIELPENLKSLYSPKLRENIAELVNKVLLRSILQNLPQTHFMNNKEFVDLMYTDIIHASNDETSSIKAGLADANHERYQSDTSDKKVLDISHQDVVSNSVLHGNFWDQTKRKLDPIVNETSFDEYLYEPKLIQLMKIWCWYENQLHVNNIGVPRLNMGNR